jgi:hypothetical protein
MSTDKRRLPRHPEAVLTCALLAGVASATPTADAAGATAETATAMNGGGDTLGGEIFSGSGGEFALFNAGDAKAAFGTFWAVTSASATPSIMRWPRTPCPPGKFQSGQRVPSANRPPGT